MTDHGPLNTSRMTTYSELPPEVRIYIARFLTEDDQFRYKKATGLPLVIPPSFAQLQLAVRYDDFATFERLIIHPRTLLQPSELLCIACRCLDKGRVDMIRFLRDSPTVDVAVRLRMHLLLPDDVSDGMLRVMTMACPGSGTEACKRCGRTPPVLAESIRELRHLGNYISLTLLVCAVIIILRVALSSPDSHAFGLVRPMSLSVYVSLLLGWVYDIRSVYLVWPYAVWTMMVKVIYYMSTPCTFTLWPLPLVMSSLLMFVGVHTEFVSFSLSEDTRRILRMYRLRRLTLHNQFLLLYLIALFV